MSILFKCPNIGNCTKADNSEIIFLPSCAPMNCPECGANLILAKGAASAPPIGSLSLGIGLLVLMGFIFLLARSLGGPKFLFAGQMVLVTAGICLIPTIANSLTTKPRRVTRILLETMLFIILIIGFSYWLFGISGLGVWIAYAVALTLLLEIGSHAIERYMVKTLERIFRSVSFKSLLLDAEAVQKMFRGEVVLYISIPMGLMLGTAAGFIGGWTKQATVTISIQFVLLFAAIVLIVFLVNAFARMSVPLFKESRGTSPLISEEPIKNRTGILGNIGKIFEVIVPRLQTNKKDQERQDLSLAVIATDLRKAYLYDSIHNVILLVACVAVIARLWNIGVDIKHVLIGLLGFSLIFSQLPFIIGQSLLHENVLNRYEGVQRIEVAEQLKKNAPLFPKLDFLTALFATGTAGGLLYFILDQFVKNALG